MHDLGIVLLFMLFLAVPCVVLAAVSWWCWREPRRVRRIGDL